VLDVFVTLYGPEPQGRMMILDAAGVSTGQDSLRVARHGVITGKGVPSLSGNIAPASDRIGEALRVMGFQLPAVIRAGDDLRVGAQVEALQPIYEDDVLFFHLLDSSGALIAQSDSLALAGDWSTAALIPHQPLGFERVIDLPDDLPPGRYRVLMGAYRWPSLERLPVSDAAGVTLPDGVIEVGWLEVK
jgi:hypothetical protein